MTMVLYSAVVFMAAAYVVVAFVFEDREFVMDFMVLMWTFVVVVTVETIGWIIFVRRKGVRERRYAVPTSLEQGSGGDFEGETQPLLKDIEVVSAFEEVAVMTREEVLHL